MDEIGRSWRGRLRFKPGSITQEGAVVTRPLYHDQVVATMVGPVYIEARRLTCAMQYGWWPVDCEIVDFHGTDLVRVFRDE